jgi:multidrug efflux pump subunit AcrA (membrane-fusion protein)
VVAEGTGAFVFVVEDERARRRPVRLGQRTAGAVEVLDGLEVGAPVVRQGMQRLRDGASVRVSAPPSAGAAAAPEGEGA